MRNRIWTLAAVLALLAVLAKFYAKPLWAQVRAALVENVDEPGRNPYLSTATIPNICAGNTGCNLLFDAVPAGKRLVVTSVTGNIYPLTPGIVYSLRLIVPAAGGSVQEISIPAFLEAGTVLSSNIVGVNAQFNAFYEPGVAPLLEISTTTSFFGGGTLTISGYLVSLP